MSTFLADFTISMESTSSRIKTREPKTANAMVTREIGCEGEELEDGKDTMGEAGSIEITLI